MSFTPANVNVYVAVFSGAIAGITATIGKPSNTTSPLTYALAASYAGGYAEVVDMLWDTTATTEADLEAFQSISESAWSELAPLSSMTSDPYSWAAMATAMVNVITAAKTYYSAQGITPPAIPDVVPTFYESIIFRPGVASGTNHVATWAEIETAIIAASGFIHIYIDDSNAACIVPATANTECYGTVVIKAYNDVDGATLTIANGGVLRNVGLLDFVFIEGAPTLQSPLVFDTAAYMYIENDAGVTANVGALVPMISIEIAFSLYVLDYAFLTSLVAGVGIIGVGIGLTFTLILGPGANPDGSHVLAANMVSGSESATLILSHSDTDIFTAQTFFLGTVSEIRQNASRAANPSRGTTGQRPALPFIGEMYFDTTLGYPLWWNGAAWAIGPMTVNDKTKLDGLQKQGVTTVIAAFNIDWSLGGAYSKTLAAGANTFTFSNDTDGQIIIVAVTGAASTLVWPAAVKWSNGIEPTQTASGTDIYTLVKVGAVVYGSYVQNMS
jgi:hypothetical protein